MTSLGYLGPSPKRSIRQLLPLLLLSASMPVAAQDADEPPSTDNQETGVILLPERANPNAASSTADPVVIDTIVVTAQKREQVRMDVPISISVLDDDTLERYGLEQFDDLAAFVPGLEVQEQSPNNPAFAIRGISSDSGESFIEPRVAIFQDGVSTSRSRGSFFELHDIERVEIVKGPQSTLFGRSALTGGINVIQNKPEYTWDAQVAARLGAGQNDGMLRTVRGHLNAPLAGDWLAGRLAFIDKQRDPYTADLLGGPGFNGTDLRAARLALRADPLDDLRIDLIANHQRDTPPGTGFKSNRFAPPGGDTSPFTAAALRNFGGFRDDAPLGLERDMDSLTAIAEWRVSDNWILNAISGYRRFDSDEIFDADGSHHDLVTAAEVATGRQFSQELRLIFDARGRFTTFFGASYLQEEGAQFVPVATDVAVGLPFFAEFLATGNVREPVTESSGVIYEEEFANQADNAAIDLFADLSFALTDRLRLTGGLRWTRDTKTTRYLGRSVTNFATPENTLFIAASENGEWQSASGRFSGIGWRAIVAFDPSDNLRTWASYSRGRRPEVIAFNTPSGSDGESAQGLAIGPLDIGSILPFPSDFAQPTTLPAEIVDSLELGGFALLWNSRLQLAGSVYAYEYENFQTTIFSPGEAAVQVRNAGVAQSRGLELEVTAQVFRDCAVFASYGYSRARFSNRDTAGRDLEFAGNRLRLSPDHAIAVGLDFARAFGFGTLSFTPSYTYRSLYFFDDNNDRPDLQASDEVQDEVQPGYGLLNLSLGYATLGERFRVEAFASNALDEQYLLDAGNTGDSFGLPTFIPGSGRLLGIALSARF